MNQNKKASIAALPFAILIASVVSIQAFHDLGLVGLLAVIGVSGVLIVVIFTESWNAPSNTGGSSLP